MLGNKIFISLASLPVAVSSSGAARAGAPVTYWEASLHLASFPQIAEGGVGAL